MWSIEKIKIIIFRRIVIKSWEFTCSIIFLNVSYHSNTFISESEFYRHGKII